ncbi:MAG: hypothetical protein H0U73_01150 [Tatlockia sp.]|nr:hypothetical protein [Tatlockia sp.]
MIRSKQENFQLLIGYQNQKKYRQAFNQLAVNTFDLSFEDWYQAGYWNNKYIPYTLFDDQKAIANVSSEDIIAIATVDGETLQLWDVFGLQCIELDKIIAAIAPPSVKKIRFGFTPIDCSPYHSKQLAGEDILFIRSKQNSILDAEPLMFPLLSHA